MSLEGNMEGRERDDCTNYIIQSLPVLVASDLFFSIESKTFCNWLIDEELESSSPCWPTNPKGIQQKYSNNTINWMHSLSILKYILETCAHM